MNSSRWSSSGRHRSPGTYFSAEARRRIDEAHRIVAGHVEMLGTDRCVACGELAPCGARTVADGTLRAYGQLPRRVPGATLGEARSAHAGQSLFRSTTGQQRYANGQPHGGPQHRATSNSQPFSWFTAPKHGEPRERT
jgi:hypothetical protein